MNNIATFKKYMKKQPTDKNVAELLDFFALHAEEAATTQKNAIADCYIGMAYWQAVVSCVGMLYVLPALGVAVFQMSFGEREIVKLPKKWASRLELAAVNERKFK